MNWEAIQALAEAVAAIGVIASLVYLAAQVRQNTRSIRNSANQDLLTSYNQGVNVAMTSEHGSRIYHALVHGSFDELSPAERSAARLAMIQINRVFEHAYLQHQAGHLDDRVWQGWMQQMILSHGMPGFAQGWQAIRQLLSPEFAKWMDQVSAASARRADEYLEQWGEVPARRPTE